MAAVPQPQPPARDFNVDYFRTTEGQLRTAEGVMSLAALISMSEGYCNSDTGRFSFSLFVLIVSLLEAILVIAMFVFRLDKFIPQINIPLSLLINDGVSSVLYFIISTLALLSIGRCDYLIAARIIASLFVLALFLVLVGLLYLDYRVWEESVYTKENNKAVGITVTESSPTVLA